MSPLHPTLRNLVTDERGNVLMTFGLTTLLAVAAVGGAIDFGRASKEKDRLQSALDAAVVGGMTKYRETNNMDEAKIRAVGLFNAQYSNAVLQNANGTLTAGRDAPLVNFTTTGGQISATATLTTTTPFLQLVTGSHLKVGTTATADLSGETLTSTTQKQLEVGIMVDLTGSMGATVNGMTKIAALKLAGADLLNILLPSSGANNAAVRVGIAPFADYVNAGEYASAVTGLAATGGTYNNITNLAWTKNGAFTGSYQGVTGNATGSQAGATPPTSGASSGGSGSTASNGATYNNAYCSNPTQTTTTQVTTTMNTSTFGTADVGTSSNYGVTGSVNTPYYFQSGNNWYYVSLAGYLSNGRPWGRLYYQRSNGSWQQYDNGAYYNSHIPNTTSQTTTTVVTGCESTTTTSTTTATPSKLISCVTERTDTANRYSSSTPNSTNGYVGAYNAGSSSKYNYSSDGKCYVAGRELPAVIPLTNDRASLSSFFTNATIGGATPGHLGTAWARYLISPEWSSIWPAASAPASYTASNVIKAVILMTDGEYNIIHAGESSVIQAKAQCDAMKAQGVQIYSVGFGFSTTSTAGDGTAEGNAKAILSYCATSSAHLFVPYDGTALRAAFTNIGTSLSTAMTTTTTTKAARVKN